MEATSVYMCFPCYQEFNTLEEVLKHQLTCTADEEQPNTSGATPVTFPVLQAQQQVINISRTVAVTQIQGQAGHSSVLPVKNILNQCGARTPKLSSDQPRILYQCGDCDELFKTLDLWQQHRKEGTCQQSTSGSKSDFTSQPEAETSLAQSSTSTLNPKDSYLSKTQTSKKPKPEPVEDVVTDEEKLPVAEASSAQNSDPPVFEVTAATSNPEDSSAKKRGANKKPKPDPVLLCVDCGSCFGLVSELVAHRKTQHGFEEALHRCSVCGECFLNTTLFLYHRKQHRQKGEEKVGAVAEAASEDICTQSNGTDEQEQDATPSTTSVTSTFTQPELFMCTQCGESFSEEGELVTHRKQNHGLKEPLHSCSHCDMSFMNTTQYLYHRREHCITSGKEVVDIAETADETAKAETQDTSQSSKRLRSPPASASESSSPLSKRKRPIFRILSGTSALKGKKGSSVKEESEGSTAADSDSTNHPLPAKLMQDWARTPLPHVCPYCGKTFTRRVFLRTHVYSHTGEKLFTCKVCTKSFSNSQSLLRHSMSHTGAKPFSCDVCDKNFSQAATLKRHQRIHTSTEPRRKRGRKPVCTLDSEGSAHLFPCPHCPSRFNTEDQLNHHKLLHTSHPFPCPECGAAFKRRKDLDLHSLTHQDKEPANCPHCSSQFVNQAVLEIHLQRCPTSEEERNTGRGRGQGRGRCTGQIECDLCGHRCMTQEGLDLHRLSHTGQTPLKCPVRPCRRRFTSNGALEEHVLAHIQGTLSKSKNQPRFHCQICQKEFAYNSTFSVHMRTHTDERPFECTKCGKRFRQLPHLQDHERIHSGLRPFCCWICGKSFSVAARLTEHARTHSGEKPYPCHHCPAAFRSRSNLDKHIRLHGELPEETAEQVAQAAEAAQVQKVLEGAKVLSSLAAAGEAESGSVQTIYVLQGGEGGTDTVMIPSDQLSGMEGTSQVVILPTSVLGAQTITVPTITMDGNEITMVEASPQHAIEFIVEETV
nr:zinc finger protein 420-like isoform X2 [Monopterus albus]XP_020466555.1 zinc finger protein 420-like isoform X2 [Monopterus albus]XP_020466556.1 zinc finger protein 420-like isoform X2 [Monopterus albus]XP_020466557.1 zinc finger protein 420-like isoform X2 [Monopterus albus]XP_020466558.1 zinc finger protein 420-like isoform X2 [Monopterus albus]